MHQLMQDPPVDSNARPFSFCHNRRVDTCSTPAYVCTANFGSSRLLRLATRATGKYGSTLPCSTALHCTLLYSTPLYSTPIHCTSLHFTLLYSNPLCSPPLHSPLLYSKQV